MELLTADWELLTVSLRVASGGVEVGARLSCLPLDRPLECAQLSILSVYTISEVHPGGYW